MIEKKSKKIKEDPEGILNKELKTLEKRREKLFKKQEPINKEIVLIHDKIEEVKNKIGKILLNKTPSNWNILLDATTGKFVYDKYYQKISNKGLVSGGENPETGQRCIKIAMIKGDSRSFGRSFSALKEILPFVKPFEKGDRKGFKFVGILEYTLSENGTYYILLNRQEKIYKLMQTRYSRTHKLKTFKSLREILEFVQEHYWYDVTDSLHGEDPINEYDFADHLEY